MQHHHGAAGSFGFALTVTLILVSLAVVYLRGSMRLRSAGMRVSAAPAISFFFGLLLIWVALASPVAALDHELLTAHMIQHLLLMTFAPPLIWLGELMVFIRGLSTRSEFSTPPMPHFVKALTQPAFCLFASSAVLIGWHIPAFFSLALNSEAWHIVQQAMFLLTGLLFWWPVVRPWPSERRPDLSIVLYLFFATLPCDILAGFLVFCDRVVYPSYLSSSHYFGFSALGDQQCAAALMWTSVTIVYLVAGTLLTLHLLSPQQRVEAL